MVLGGQTQSLEGKSPIGNIVLLQFDSIDQANAWYDSEAYRRLREIRNDAADTQCWLIEGV